MKNRVLMAAAVVLLCGAFGRAQQPDLVHMDRVLAVVGDTVITQFDVQNELVGLARSMRSRRQLEQFRERAEELADSILDRLIREELVYAEFKKQGFMLPPELIQERVDAIITREAGGDREAFAAMVEESPITMEELREQVKRRVAVELMMQQHVRRDAHVTPGQVRRYYQEHRAEFNRPGTAVVRMLVLSVQDRSEAERTAAVKELRRQSLVQKLREKTGATASLKQLAEKQGAAYSEETYLLGSRNELAAPGDPEAYPLRPELLTRLRTLDEGERAGPLLLEGQVLLLELVERSPGGQRSLDEDLRRRIRQRLQLRKEERLMDGFIDELKEKHFVKRME